MVAACKDKDRIADVARAVCKAIQTQESGRYQTQSYYDTAEHKRAIYTILEGVFRVDSDAMLDWIRHSIRASVSGPTDDPDVEIEWG
jgi:hypothetical protein